MDNPVKKARERVQKMSRRERLAIAFTALALAGIIMIVIVALQVWLPNRLVSYRHPQWGFSLKYPAGWRQDQNNFGAAAAFITPKESDIDVFQENVVIVVQDLSAHPISLKKYSDMGKTQIVQLFGPTIKVTEYGQTYFADTMAYQMIYEGVDQSNPTLNLKARYIWCIKDDIAFQFNYTALVGKYDKYIDTVKKMQDSFRLP